MRKKEREREPLMKETMSKYEFFLKNLKQKRSQKLKFAL